MAQHDDHDYSSPFEGPEKLLEIWFAQSPACLPDAPPVGVVSKYGLRKVPREVWEDMLDIVKCKVLNMIEGNDIDAYLLSESSLFIFPHRLILKTCGTTLNLLGLPRILEIASMHACLPSVYRFFYSRKSFMFPERQLGPHREWKDEVQYLDGFFQHGAAYTVGKVNGDHWLLYLTSPVDEAKAAQSGTPVPPALGLPHLDIDPKLVETDLASLNKDYTIEILMSNLAHKSRIPFFTDQSVETPETPSEQGAALSSAIGISDIFPSHLTTLDAYAFSPCGYSSNAILRWGEDDQEGGQSGEGYYSIHVTPEEGWSYASFECNVPLPTRPMPQAKNIPDLKTLICRVVNIFKPERLTLTLFISSENNNIEEEEGETTVEAAQRVFKAALTVPQTKVNGTGGGQGRIGLYRRTDKINYEFGGYDLAFASFELRS